MSIDPAGNVWKDMQRLPGGVAERYVQLIDALLETIEKQGEGSRQAKAIEERIKLFEKAFPALADEKEQEQSPQAQTPQTESTSPEDGSDDQPGDEEAPQAGDDTEAQETPSAKAAGESDEEAPEAGDESEAQETPSAKAGGESLEEAEPGDTGVEDEGRIEPEDVEAQKKEQEGKKEEDGGSLDKEGEGMAPTPGDKSKPRHWGERVRGWDVRDSRELEPGGGTINYVPKCEELRPYNPVPWIRGHLVPQGPGEKRPLWHSVVDVSDLARCLDLKEGHVRRDVNQKWWKQHMHEGEMGSNREWYGGLTSWGGVRRMMRDGWVEGAQKADELSLELEQQVRPPESVRRRPRRRDDGNDLDIDRAMRGQVDSMWWRSVQEHSPQGGRIVKLVSTFGGNSNRTSDQLIWSAATMIATCRLLETAGYSVGLSAVIPTEHANGGEATYALAEVEVKRPGEALQIDMAAAVFGHAGVFRTAGFAYMHANPWDVDSGLGRETSALPLVERAARHGITQAPTLVFDHVFSKEEAMKEFVTALERVTGEKEFERSDRGHSR